MNKLDDVENLLRLKEGELAEILGKEILRSALKGKQSNKKEKETLGRTWLNTNIKAIAEQVCKNSKIKHYLNSPQTRKSAELVTAIADVIASTVGSLPVFVVATMIVNQGLENLCSKIDTK